MTTEAEDGPFSTTDASDTVPSSISYWKSFLFIFCLATIFGNVLVCLGPIVHRSLRTITSYFIVSLAAADLLVGLVVMPGAIYVQVVGAWTFGNLACDIWITLDVLMSTASIFNLCVISLERLYAVTKPLHYATHRTTRHAGIAIALVWIISTAISSPILFGINNTLDRETSLCILYKREFMVWSSIFSFVVPSSIMLVVYVIIYINILKRRSRVSEMTENYAAEDHTEVSTFPTKANSLHKVEDQRKRTNELRTSKTTHQMAPLAEAGNIEGDSPPSSSDANQEEKQKTSTQIHQSPIQPNQQPPPKNKTKNGYSFKKEKKATKTLAIVIGVFMVCWLPFFTINIRTGDCPSCYFPTIIIDVAVWLGYCNSLLNPMIYAVSNKEWKKAFLKILTLCCSKTQK